MNTFVFEPWRFHHTKVLDNDSLRLLGLSIQSGLVHNDNQAFGLVEALSAEEKAPDTSSNTEYLRGDPVMQFVVGIGSHNASQLKHIKFYGDKCHLKEGHFHKPDGLHSQLGFAGNIRIHRTIFNQTCRYLSKITLSFPSVDTIYLDPVWWD